MQGNGALRVKITCQPHPGVKDAHLRLHMQDTVRLIASWTDEYSVVDRGHTFSSGLTQVCIWLRQRTLQGRSADPYARGSGPDDFSSGPHDGDNGPGRREHDPWDCGNDPWSRSRPGATPAQNHTSPDRNVRPRTHDGDIAAGVSSFLLFFFSSFLLFFFSSFLLLVFSSCVLLVFFFSSFLLFFFRPSGSRFLLSQPKLQGGAPKASPFNLSQAPRTGKTAMPSSIPQSHRGAGDPAAAGPPRVPPLNIPQGQAGQADSIPPAGAASHSLPHQPIPPVPQPQPQQPSPQVQSSPQQFDIGTASGGQTSSYRWGSESGGGLGPAAMDWTMAKNTSVQAMSANASVVSGFPDHPPPFEVEGSAQARLPTSQASLASVSQTSQVGYTGPSMLDCIFPQGTIGHQVWKEACERALAEASSRGIPLTAALLAAVQAQATADAHAASAASTTSASQASGPSPQGAPHSFGADDAAAAAAAAAVDDPRSLGAAVAWRQQWNASAYAAATAAVAADLTGSASAGAGNMQASLNTSERTASDASMQHGSGLVAWPDAGSQASVSMASASQAGVDPNRIPQQGLTQSEVDMEEGQGDLMARSAQSLPGHMPMPPPAPPVIPHHNLRTEHHGRVVGSGASAPPSDEVEHVAPMHRREWEALKKNSKLATRAPIPLHLRSLEVAKLALAMLPSLQRAMPLMPPGATGPGLSAQTPSVKSSTHLAVPEKLMLTAAIVRWTACTTTSTAFRTVRTRKPLARSAASRGSAAPPIYLSPWPTLVAGCRTGRLPSSPSSAEFSSPRP